MPVRFDKNAVAALEKSYLTPEIKHQRERMLAQLALTEGDRVLDAGCGVGLLTETLCERVGVSGRVAACDQSAAMVEATASRCAGRANLDKHEASVCDLPFEDGSFDAVALAQVLLYVERPVDALCEVRRVLRPGGVVSIVETDWRGVVMATDEPERVRRVFAAWDAAVPSPGLPCALQPALQAAGLVFDAVEAVPLVNTRWDDDGFSMPMVRDLARMAVKRHALTSAEADALLAEMDARGDSDSYFFCVNRFVFRARCPGGI
ncbi:MAG: methyltransferase domain-containing protein [Pseudomonadota bacterium]